MISDIGFRITLLGLPLVLWLGIAAGLGFLLTAVIMVLNQYTKIRIPVKWHHRLAFASLALMLIHAALALAIFL